MEKQELKSKWDDLAREIGAEIPPETEQREQEASAIEPQSPHQINASEPQPIRPLPKRAPVDWNHLATDLGLPPGEPVADAIERDRPAPPERPPARESRPPARESQPPVRESQPTARESQPRPAARERTEGRERTGRREPPEKRRERPEPRRDREEKPRSPRSASADSRDDSKRQSTPDVQPPPAAPPRVREEPPKPTPSVSLWHKIFGSPTEQTAKVSDVSADSREAGEPSHTYEEPRALATGSSSSRLRSDDDAPAADFVDDSSGADEATRATEDGSPSDRKRGRPRRRRRGGRGRKQDERQSESQPTAQRKQEPRSSDELDVEFDDGSDDLSDLADDDDISESELDDSGTELDDDTDADPGAPRTTRTKSAAQRTIPSWDQAIGFIVDSNMQSRSQRRPPSRSDARGNSSRGRPRGGRRKK